MVVLGALLAVPLLVWSVMWVRHGWVPQGDQGWIALKTHDVFSAHPPLQGMRSTSARSWPGVWAHHPGPLEFYLLAVPYAATGFHPAGLVLGCFLLDAGLIAIALWHGRRAHPVHGVVVVVVAIVGSELLLGPSLVLPWNPWPPVLGSIALLVLAWRLLLGHRSALLWFVAVCSLVLQCNLALVAFFAPLLLTLGGVGLLRWRRASSRHTDQWRVPVLWSVVVGVLLWLPAIVELFLVSPNNASQLWAIAFLQLRNPLHAAAFAGLVAGCYWAARQLASDDQPSARYTARWISVLFVAGVVLSVLAGGGERVIYVVMVVGALIFAAAVWQDRWPAARRAHAVPPWGWVGLGLLVALLVGPSAPIALPFTRIEADYVRDAKPVVRNVESGLRARGVDTGSVIVGADGVTAAGSYQLGVVAQLAADGYSPYFDTFWSRPEDDAFRRVRNAPPGAVRVVLHNSGPPTIILPTAE